MIHIIFSFIKPYTEPSHSVDESTVVKATAPIREETFHYVIKVITQNYFLFAVTLRTDLRHTGSCVAPLKSCP